MTLLPPIWSSKDDFGWRAGPREITCREINEKMIGREVARESFIDGQARQRELREQSEHLINRLGRMGIDGVTGRGAVSIVGLVTGQVERATDYRNCNLIPTQQSRNVRDMMKHVQYLADTTRPGRLRMLVVSGGWCRFDHYRRDHKAHTRRMSKFAAHPKLKELGITIEYYNVENTIHRDAVAMLNMHSHVLFRCNRYLGKRRWSEFLDFARGFFPKGYVHDSKIKKPKEVVKYVFKPAEFDLLTDEELAELWHQIVGGRPKFDPETGEIETRVGPDGEVIDVCEGPLKFFHPLGSMRAFRSELRHNGQKLILVPTRDDRWIWRLTEKRLPEEKPEATDSEPRQDAVLAITRPMPKFTRRMEPCLVVQDYRGDFERLIHQNGLERARSDASAIYAQRIRNDAARAQESAEPPSPIKDTTTTTVPEWDAMAGAHPPLPSPEPPGEADARFLQ